MSGMYEHVAEQYLSVHGKSGNEWMVNCIVHEDSNASMQFNVASGLWLCFACQESGNIRTLQRHLGIEKITPIYDVADLRRKLKALGRVPAEEKALPESRLARYHFPTPYWADRGFTQATIEAFDLGYYPLGDEFGEFVTIPLRRTDGGLLGFIRRYIGEDVDKNERYRYPRGYKKSHHLFGSWLVDADESADMLVLVEGSTDAMKVWQAGYPSVAIYGNCLSTQQARMIRQLGITKLVRMFDRDKGGKDAADSCIGIRHHRSHGKPVNEYVRECDLSREFIISDAPIPPTKNDPGQMSDDEIRKAIRWARRIDI